MIDSSKVAPRRDVHMIDASQGGNMLSQQGGWWWAYAGDGQVSSMGWTVQMSNQNIFAEVALVRTYEDYGDQWPWAEIGITQVVSNGVTENFSEDYPRALWRVNVSSISYQFGSVSCFAESRWIANAW